jgi:SAM-dependent methyltransferase
VKLLVAIASYGSKNDVYLERVISEYRGMPFQTDIVVLSNIYKDLGSDIEVVVGLPNSNPWSLPFGHKRIFAKRKHDYDLFLYTEDDMLVTQRNIEAFLRVTRLLASDEIAGFFQFEEYPDGRLYFPAVHGHFHWIPESLRKIDGYTFAQFSNEHSACYLLTREQLERAIASGGYLVGPHEGRHDLLVTAATDPYTQCGFRKMLCISHLKDFLTAHLPNKYLGTTLGLDEPDFRMQIDALLRSECDRTWPKPLLEPDTKLLHCYLSKDYYEQPRHDVMALVPSSVRNVLSIGCGWGATEEVLVKRGVRVIGVPVDPLIGVCAESRGTQVVYGDLQQAVLQLQGQRFDAIVMIGVLHLLADPYAALRAASLLLSDQGRLILSLPNFDSLPLRARKLKERFGDYSHSRVHAIGARKAELWMNDLGFSVVRIPQKTSEKWQPALAASLGLAARYLASELTLVGQRTSASRARAPVAGMLQ